MDVVLLALVCCCYASSVFIVFVARKKTTAFCCDLCRFPLLALSWAALFITQRPRARDPQHTVDLLFLSRKFTALLLLLSHCLLAVSLCFFFFHFQTHTVRCVVFYMRDSVEERLLALRNAKVCASYGGTVNVLLLLLLLLMWVYFLPNPRLLLGTIKPVKRHHPQFDLGGHNEIRKQE